MKFPLLIINLKAYKESLNPSIASIAKKVSKETGIEIVLCPSHVFLREMAQAISCFAQSIDPVDAGAHTGANLAEHAKMAGAVGTLINHSEKRITFEDIKKCVELCKSHGLLSCVCAKNDDEAELIAQLKPDMIATEPPELIGGVVSVSTAKPEVISNSVRRVKKISPGTKILCGAGVQSSSDAKKAVELGADGLLVSSAIVKARDVEKAMKDIAEGLKR